MDSNTISVLSLAFGLGLLHALDADHIMAVSGLSCARQGLRNSMKFCVHWAIGHGTSLFLIGMAIFALGMTIPDSLSRIAEFLVSAILILIGVWMFWDLFKQRAHLHFHQHDRLPQHAHWHAHEKEDHITEGRDQHRHDHGAIIVGLLHGAAGSAPLLALIPLAQIGSVWLGITYLILFGIGVLTAMVIFGGLLGSSLKWLSQRGNYIILTVRSVVALGAIAVGTRLIYGML